VLLQGVMCEPEPPGPGASIPVGGPQSSEWTTSVQEELGVVGTVVTKALGWDQELAFVAADGETRCPVVGGRARADPC
jgi:hypothetical protein